MRNPHTRHPHTRYPHTRHSNISSLKVRLALTLCALLSVSIVTLSQGEARPRSLSIKSMSAPYPKHCLDERQWLDPQRSSPYNLFDGDQTSAWSPCLYALKDPGYTVNFTFTMPIELDGMVISQQLTPPEDKSVKTQGRKQRRRVRKRAQPQPQRRFQKVQVLFYSSAISDRYPIYFQDVLFNGEREIELEYRDPLKWNPILISDSNFDERRQALGLEASGIEPPLEIDRVGIVFWELEGSGAPPALSELSFKLKGETYRAHVETSRLKTHAERIGRGYHNMIEDRMYLSDERALIFARSGTIWAMEGEEEVAKVMGAWRRSAYGIEVDLSNQQHKRASARQRRRIERRRARAYKPLHLIIDEAPRRVFIKNSALAGEYQIERAPVPTLVIGPDQDETPPPFEAP